MKNTESLISKLKSNIQSIAFLISKGGAEKQAHLELVQCLILLAELEDTISIVGSTANRNEITLNSAELDELDKIRRKLKLWAKKQEQINSKILNAYLILEREGVNPISEDVLEKESNIPSFSSNFSGMKLIGERNHAKIFEAYGHEVRLWEHAEPFVREYERVIFK